MHIIEAEHIDISAVVAALKQGNTVVYPTETCYGLGCDSTNPTAVERVFTIKERQSDKPMLLLMADEAMARRYVEWSAPLQALSDRYWPGPVTAVARALPSAVVPSLRGADNSLAFRITSHPIAHALCESLGVPLVSTSANISSLKSPYDIESILAMYAGRAAEPDMLIHAGTLPERAPSTIISTLGPESTVLRQGDVIVNRLI